MIYFNTIQSHQDKDVFLVYLNVSSFCVFREIYLATFMFVFDIIDKFKLYIWTLYQ